jgi:peptidoglycan/LPS O-acetylase OafA/YrhL
VKNAYLYHEQAEYFQRGIFGGLLLRYISFALVIGVMYLLKQSKNIFFKDNQDVQKTFDIAVSITLLWVMSSEMVHWLELSGYTQTYKWAISVLFGIFALGLVSYGISKKKKHLRIAAIVLFVLTLIKLFAFDLMGLDTIAKTIVLVSLGLLLLTISYVYTKFKDTLLGED